MNLFEWNKLTKYLCPICRSRLFASLTEGEKNELIDSIAEIHELEVIIHEGRLE